MTNKTDMNTATGIVVAVVLVVSVLALGLLQPVEKGEQTAIFNLPTAGASSHLAGQGVYPSEYVGVPPSFTAKPSAAGFVVTGAERFTGADHYFPSNGDGTFGTRSNIAGLGVVDGMDVADMDNDGDNDFLACDGTSKEVYLFTNGGTGTFTTSQVASGVSSGGFCTNLRVADFNQDGMKDFVVGDNGVTNGMFVYTQTAPGTFAKGATSLDVASWSTVGGNSLFGVAVGDVDGDNHQDILVLGYFGIGAGQMRFYKGDGMGGMSASTVKFNVNTDFGTGGTVGLGLFDLEGDGDLDIIVGGGTSTASDLGGGKHFIYTNDGTGTFTKPVTDIFDLNAQTGIDASDFDGDGDHDLVIATFGTRTLQYVQNIASLGAPVFVSSLDGPSIGIGAPELAAVDTTPPSITNISDTPDPFSPNVQPDGVKDTTTISFTSNEAGTYSIEIKNSVPATVRTLTGVVNSGINNVVWDGTSNPVVPDGTYTYFISVTDAASNSRTPPGAGDGAVTVDTVRPVTSITGATNGDGDPVANNGLSDSDEINISFSADGTGSGVAFSECRLVPELFATCTSPYQRTALPEGQNRVDIRSTDDAGNLETTATFTWTVDTIAPSFDNDADISPDISSASITVIDIVTDATSGVASVSGKVKDSVGAQVGATFALLPDGDTLNPDDYKGTFTFPPLPAAPDGVYDVFISATDVAGNGDEKQVGSVQLDRTMPTATMMVTTPFYVNSGDDVTVKIAALDAESGIPLSGVTVEDTTAGTPPVALIQTSFDDTNNNTVFDIGEEGTWEVTFAANAGSATNPEEDHTLVGRVDDNAEPPNTKTITKPAAFHVDDTDPVASIASVDPNPTITNPTVTATITDSPSSPIVSAQFCIDNCVGESAVWNTMTEIDDNGIFGQDTSVEVEGVINASVLTPAPDVHTVYVRGEDSAGNVSIPDTEEFTVLTDVELLKTSTPFAFGFGVPANMLVAGTNIEWELEIRNNSVISAAGVVATDTVPTSHIDPTTIVFESVPADMCSFADPLLTCNFGTLAAGGTATVTITGTSFDDLMGTPLEDTGTPVVNAASVDSSTPEIDDAPYPLAGTPNNSKTTSNDVTRRADLTANKEANPSDFPADPGVPSNTVVAGTPITYTIIGGSGGPSIATNVHLTDDVPSEITSVSASATVTSGVSTTPRSCTVNGNSVDCALGDLSPGDTYSVTIAGTVKSDTPNGSISDTAMIASVALNPPATVDHNTANNAPTVNTPVTTRADRQTTKFNTPGVIEILPGAQGTHTIEVHNNGPSDAQSVQITDSMSADSCSVSSMDVCVVSITPTVGGTPQGTCSTSPTGVSCNIGTIANGVTARIEIVLSFANTTPGPFMDTASATSTTVDHGSRADSVPRTTLKVSQLSQNGSCQTEGGGPTTCEFGGIVYVIGADGQPVPIEASSGESFNIRGGYIATFFDDASVCHYNSSFETLAEAQAADNSVCEETDVTLNGEKLGETFRSSEATCDAGALVGTETCTIVSVENKYDLFDVDNSGVVIAQETERFEFEDSESGKKKIIINALEGGAGTYGTVEHWIIQKATHITTVDGETLIAHFKVTSQNADNTYARVFRPFVIGSSGTFDCLGITGLPFTPGSEEVTCTMRKALTGEVVATGSTSVSGPVTFMPDPCGNTCRQYNVPLTAPTMEGNYLITMTFPVEDSGKRIRIELAQVVSKDQIKKIEINNLAKPVAVQSVRDSFGMFKNMLFIQKNVNQEAVFVHELGLIAVGETKILDPRAQSTQGINFDGYVLVDPGANCPASLPAAGSLVNARTDFDDYLPVAVPANDLGLCGRSYIDWTVDDDLVPDNSRILEVNMRIDIEDGQHPSALLAVTPPFPEPLPDNARTCDIMPMIQNASPPARPQTLSDTALWNEMGNGTPYVPGSTVCAVLNDIAAGQGHNLLIPLGAAAATNLKSTLEQDFFAVGIKFNGENFDGSDHDISIRSRLLGNLPDGSPTKATLEIKYSLPPGAVYRAGTSTAANALSFREWTGTAWTNPAAVLPTTGSAILGAQLEFGPGNSRVVASLSITNGALNLFRCLLDCDQSANWNRIDGDAVAAGINPLELLWGTTAPVAPKRPFDIAVEKTSGEVVIFYDRNPASAEANEINVATFNAVTGALTETGVSIIAGNTNPVISYIDAVSSPISGSNQIAVIFQDRTNQDVYAAIWNGDTNTLGNVKQISDAQGAAGTTGAAASDADNSESIGIAYETTSGDVLAVAGHGADNLRYCEWDQQSVAADKWCTSLSTTDPNSAAGNDVRTIRVTASPVSGSDELMICQEDDLADITCNEWSGTGFGTWTALTGITDITPTGARSFDFQWNPTGGTGVALYSSNIGTGTSVSTTAVSYKTWSGTAFSAASTVTYTGAHDWVIGARNPDALDTAVKSLWLIINAASDIGGLKWDGTTMVCTTTTAATPPACPARFTADAIITEEVFDIKFDIP